MNQTTIKIIFLSSLMIGGIPLTASADRNNPFIPQLPEPVIVKPEPLKSEDQLSDKTRLEIHQPDRAPTPVPPPNFMITGLVWNTNRPQAIINDQVVDVGDRISDYQIVSISKTGIKVESQGQTFTVTP